MINKNVTFKEIKKYYILILIILLLGSFAIYGTYAMFTSTVETDDIVNMDTIMNYTFDINGTQKITVGAKTKARFNAVVKNSMNGKICYGLYYKIINPSSLPNDIIIAQVSDDLTFISKGMVEASSSVTVPLVIKNNSDTDITVEIGVRTGYVTVNQGVDDIIYNEGEIPITSFLTNEEAGDDKYISTMECTTECTNKVEDGKLKEICYCYTGKEMEIPSRTSTEMLQYLGLTAKTGTPDFATAATTDEGVYSINDDYGKSYYFRGASTKNYVKFANKWWRIIRINGDGTIRMIYDGTSAHVNGESSADRQIGESRFNGTYGDNAYEGYMMGIDNECASSSDMCLSTINTTSYAQATNNKYSSTIKIMLDDWYKTNIVDVGLSEKIADVIYCNDRSLDASQGGDGIGANVTDYGADYRLNDNRMPILTCPQKNDAFTVNDEVKGNGALTYPVGLITADEVSVAGGVYGISNTSYYLYTNNDYHVMSPSYFRSNYVYGFHVYTNGRLINNAFRTNPIGVRPVISLKSNILLSGAGTMSDPFVVD